MLVLPQKITARWVGNLKKWYINKGYVFTKILDYFECDVLDLIPTSTIKVRVICDYCKKEYLKEYRNYINDRKIIDTDACRDYKCSHKKQEEVMIKKYGVRNNMQLEASKERLRKLYQTDFDEVKKVFESKKLKLLSTKDDYKSDRSYLRFICLNHIEFGIQKIIFASVKSNKGCCKHDKFNLISQKLRLDGNIVYNAFLNADLLPQFKPSEYKNNAGLLPYICPLHKDKGIQYRSYGMLKTTKGCYYCSIERTRNALKLEEEYVFNEFKKRGLIVSNNEHYVTTNNYIKCECEKHLGVEQYITYSNLVNVKQPCLYCRIESSISKLNRRLRTVLYKWKKDSEKLCNKKCILTGSGDYQIHHLYSFDAIIKNILNELNLEIKNIYSGEEFLKIKNKILEYHEDNLGVCISSKLHTLFHKLYLKYNNTPEQFEEFKQRYYDGEFDYIKLAI